MKPRFLYEDWEFNVLEIYNYRKPGPFRSYYEFVLENHAHLEGDIVEAGVYRGRSLLAMALLLKELGSDKVIYGYDTWTGFPPNSDPKDSQEQWEELAKSGKISQAHRDKVNLNHEYRSLVLATQGVSRIDTGNISSSGVFANTSRMLLEEKIKFLGLDNIRLVEGTFEETMLPQNPSPEQVMAVLVDCDLYAGYKTVFNFVWERLVRGGYIFLDEYYSLKFPGARIATDEFFSARQDKPQMHSLIEGDFERWFVRKLYD